MAKETGHPGQGRADSFRETDLKICELCGWLNLESNEECFVCGWRGRFERDSDLVRAALELAVRKYGGRLELEHLTNSQTYRPPVPPTLRSRWQALQRRFWCWLRNKS